MLTGPTRPGGGPGGIGVAHVRARIAGLGPTRMCMCSVLTADAAAQGSGPRGDIREQHRPKLKKASCRGARAC